MALRQPLRLVRFVLGEVTEAGAVVNLAGDSHLVARTQRLQRHVSLHCFPPDEAPAGLQVASTDLANDIQWYKVAP